MTHTIAIGADHAGFQLKDELGRLLEANGYEVLDLGTNSADAVDYPDFSAAVGHAVQDGRAWRGLIVCGSGAGACIAANKLTGIRAALAHDTYSAHQVVEHDDANVLCLGARIIGGSLAEEIVLAWAGARFTGEERHQRRLDKVLALEANPTASEHAR
ncbi:MAG: sugar-phosphate isomerase, RpiB/LacA/LacB family [Thermoleophilia bacterium]|jgi:RpiB/LacA/LacB family sugar-phosphate isomerase|nr:sugar-phosphate isomerase, RpiB/LacA/LacB family [Thermoleophilia bacterium]